MSAANAFYQEVLELIQQGDEMIESRKFVELIQKYQVYEEDINNSVAFYPIFEKYTKEISEWLDMPLTSIEKKINGYNFTKAEFQLILVCLLSYLERKK